MQLFGGDVTVAIGEQQRAESHPLTRRAQSGGAQLGAQKRAKLAAPWLVCRRWPGRRPGRYMRVHGEGLKLDVVSAKLGFVEFLPHRPRRLMGSSQI